MQENLMHDDEKKRRGCMTQHKENKNSHIQKID